MKSCTRNSLCFIVLALCALMVSCAPSAKRPQGAQDRTDTHKPVIVVSIEPQAYLVNRLAGDLVDVLVLVGPGQNPHSYEPSPRQMSDLSKAVLWFTVGVEFETALEPKFASMYPDLVLADTTTNVRYRLLDEHEHEADSAEHDEADGQGKDQHIWLGRQAVEAQLGVMRAQLALLLPDKTAQVDESYRGLFADIESAYKKLTALLEPVRGGTVLVYHPAFGYFLDDFGIRQIAVETGGKEPTPKTLAAILEEAKREKATTVFVQAQFPASAASTLADALGGRVVAMDPLAADWLDNLLRMGMAIAGAAE